MGWLSLQGSTEKFLQHLSTFEGFTLNTFMGKTNTKLEFKVKLKTSNFGFKMYLLGSKVYLPEYQLCVYSSWNIYLSSEIKPVVVRSCSIRQKVLDLVILNSQRGNFLPMNCYSFGKHSAPIALRWGVKKHQGIHNVVKSGLEYFFFFPCASIFARNLWKFYYLINTR